MSKSNTKGYALGPLLSRGGVGPLVYKLIRFSSGTPRGGWAREPAGARFEVNLIGYNIHQ